MAVTTSPASAFRISSPVQRVKGWTLMISLRTAALTTGASGAFGVSDMSASKIDRPVYIDFSNGFLQARRQGVLVHADI